MLFVKRTTHDALRTERDALSKAYDVLVKQRDDLANKNAVLERKREAVEANLTAQIRVWETKYTTLEQTFLAFGQREAELVTLIVEANRIFLSFPTTKVAKERAGEIAKWQAECGKVAVLDGKATEE